MAPHTLTSGYLTWTGRGRRMQQFVSSLPTVLRIPNVAQWSTSGHSGIAHSTRNPSGEQLNSREFIYSPNRLSMYFEWIVWREAHRLSVAPPLKEPHSTTKPSRPSASVKSAAAGWLDLSGWQ